MMMVMIVIMRMIRVSMCVCVCIFVWGSDVSLGLQAISVPQALGFVPIAFGILETIIDSSVGTNKELVSL